jgi:hypothetical protein
MSAESLTAEEQAAVVRAWRVTITRDFVVDAIDEEDAIERAFWMEDGSPIPPVVSVEPKS